VNPGLRDSILAFYGTDTPADPKAAAALAELRSLSAK
jgi:hypothetical protein